MNLDDYPKTIASVNKFLRERGFTVRAVSAGSYYYFLDHRGQLVDRSVQVYRASHLEFRHWLDEAEEAQRLADEFAADFEEAEVRRRRAGIKVMPKGRSR